MRSQINETISIANTGTAVIGAEVTITHRDGTPATVYANPTGQTALTQPLVSSTRGRVPGWLENGSYILNAVPALGRPSFTADPIFIEMINGDTQSNGLLGQATLIVGPTLPVLASGTEYVWNVTDGQGRLLDIRSGVAE